MSAFAKASEQPKLRILVQTRDGLASYETPSPPSIELPKKAGSHDFEVTPETVLANNVPCSLTEVPIVLSAAPRLTPFYDRSGRFLCIVPQGQNIVLVDTANFDTRLEIPNADAQSAYFSPLGGFLLTWSLPSTTTQSGEGNFRVWSTSNGELITSMAMKSFRSDLVQFSNDERFVFKQITNEVQIFSSHSLLFQDHTAIVARIQLKGFSQYKVAPVTSGESLSIAFFFPESGGNPGRVSIVAVNLNSFEVSEPMGSRSIFGASDAALMWNATATALLIFSRSNVDTSGASYTGAAAVYFMSANGEDSGKVEQTKDGPVHDVQWSPDGEKFVMIAGKMPAQVTLFNAKAEPIYQFGALPRNTVVWSPHGRFLCIAGFGNLAGEMDFYDVLRLKKIGSNASDCSIRFGWSPDSRYFLTASLAPRMNVDNNMKIFRYNGDGPLLRMDFDRAYEATWMPVTAGVFPNRGPSPGRSQVSQMEREQRQKAAAEKAAAKPAAYRPPRSTGTVASMLTRDTSSAPVGKVKSTAAPTASSSSSSTGKFVPSAKSRSIPGMGAKPAATPATTSTSSTKPQQQQQSQQKSGNGTNNSAITGRGNAPPVAAAVAAPAPVESAADREKRAKALQKKLKQIEEIKTRIAAGQAVDAEQRKKVESEASLREELRSLSA